MTTTLPYSRFPIQPNSSWPQPITADKPTFGAMRDLSPQRAIQTASGIVGDVSVGNMSTNELSTRALVAGINLIQIYYAVTTHQHVMERIGTVVLQTAINWGLGRALDDSSNSLGGKLFDAGIEDRHLAFEIPKPVHSGPVTFLSTPKRLAKDANHWFANNVQRHIQATIGLDGDYQSEVLMPSRHKHLEGWTGHLKNDTDRSRQILKAFLEGDAAKLTLRQLFDHYRFGQTTKEDALLEIKGRAMADYFTELQDHFNPVKNLEKRGKQWVTMYLDEQRPDQLGIEKAQERFTHRMTRLLRLYDALPSGKPEAISAWIANTPKLKAEEWNQYLNKLGQEWEEHSAPLINKGAEKVVNKLESLIEATQNLRHESLIDQQVQWHQDALSHVKHVDQIHGELPEILNPLFRLTERNQVMRGGMDRRTYFLAAVVGIQAGLTMLINGKFLMWFVYNTFAKLDPDYNPEGWKKGHGAPKPATNPTSTATNQPSTISPSLERPAVEKLTPLPVVLRPTMPTGPSSVSNPFAPLMPSGLAVSGVNHG